MEDNFNNFVNGRQPQLFSKGSESNLKQLNITIKIKTMVVAPLWVTYFSISK